MKKEETIILFHETISKYLNNEYNNINEIIRDLFKVFHEAINTCKFHDEFEFTYHIGIGLNLFAESKKTGCKISFGYDEARGSIFVDVDIENAYYIKNLQDDFLIELFSTCNKYNIVYKENCWNDNSNPIYHPSFKSNILRLYRNYTAEMLENEEEAFSNYMIGSFEKEWIHPSGVDYVFDELCIAIKILYRLNYLLWKQK